MVDFNQAANEWAAQAGFNEEASKELASATNKADFWSPVNGQSIIRILPPGKDGNVLFDKGMWGIRHARYEVWSNGPFTNFTGDKGLFASCGARTLPAEYMSDPVKEALERNHEYLPSDVTERFYAKNKVMVNVLVKEIRDERNNIIDPDQCWKPVVASMPAKFWAFLTDKDNHPLFNPYSGIDIRVTRTGQKLKTEYTWAFLPGVSASPVVELAQVPGLLGQVEDIYDLVKGQIDRSKQSEASIIKLIEDLASKTRDQVSAMTGAAPSSGYPAGMSPPSFAPPTVPGGATQPPPAFAAPPAPPAPVPPAGFTPPPSPVSVVAPPPPPPQEPIGFQTSFAPPAATPTPAPVPQAAPPVAPVEPPAATVVEVAAQPDCVGQYIARNPGATMDAPTDTQCQPCPARMVCYFQATSGFNS